MELLILDLINKMKLTHNNFTTLAKPPLVVCPLDDHMGLDISRIMASQGIQVYGIDHNRFIPGRFSKACRFIYCRYSERDEEQYIGFLQEFGSQLKIKPVIFPLSDDHVSLFSKYRENLSPYFAFMMPEHSLVKQLVTKAGLYSLLCKNGMPSPKTFFVNNMDSFKSNAEQVDFPAIIKPEESSLWHSERASRLLRKGLFAGRPKVIYCQNFKELKEAYEQIMLVDKRVVIQEVIPGKDSNLIYVAFYCDANSEVLGYFSGIKLRVIPKGFGSASYVKSYDDPELKSIVISFLKKINYRGLGGIEFKRDGRSGVYKLIEFNPRFGMWDGLSARCGVNLPYIAYMDIIGRPVERKLEFRSGIIWVDWQRDIRAFIEYRNSGEITLRKWLKSLKGEKMVAIFSCSDWKPGLFLSLNLLIRLLKRTAIELSRTLSNVLKK